MKILIYSPRFYPQVGGLENFTLLLAKELIKLQHEVKVITHAPFNGTTCGIEVFYSPRIITQLKIFCWSNVLYMPNLSLKGIWLLLFNPFKKWVVSHNVWYDGYNFHTRATARVKLFLLHFCKNISASQAIANTIPVKSAIIYYGYDRNVFHKNYDVSRDRHKLLYVGRLVSDKGIDTLIQAFAFLRNENKSLQLTIVGDGEEKDKLNLMILENKLYESVKLIGKKTGAELAKVMNEHAIMVIPSKWAEPFGIVALEGLACGCKIVCSNAGGLPEAAGKFGNFFNNGNVNELINTLDIVLSQPDKENQNDINHFLAQFDLTKSAKAYLEVFRKK